MVCQLLLHMAIATCMHVYVHSYIAVTIVLPNYTVNSLISYIANNQLTIELHTLITCQPYMSLCYYYSMFLSSLHGTIGSSSSMFDACIAPEFTQLLLSKQLASWIDNNCLKFANLVVELQDEIILAIASQLCL